MLDALFEQWQRVPPAAVGIARARSSFGIGDKPRSDPKQRDEALGRLVASMPAMSADALVEPMSPEDFRKLRAPTTKH